MEAENNPNGEGDEARGPVISLELLRLDNISMAECCLKLALWAVGNLLECSNRVRDILSISGGLTPQASLTLSEIANELSLVHLRLHDLLAKVLFLCNLLKTT